jgi:hypothetical protein
MVDRSTWISVSHQETKLATYASGMVDRSQLAAVRACWDCRCTDMKATRREREGEMHTVATRFGTVEAFCLGNALFVCPTLRGVPWDQMGSTCVRARVCSPQTCMHASLDRLQPHCSLSYVHVHTAWIYGIHPIISSGSLLAHGGELGQCMGHALRPSYWTHEFYQDYTMMTLLVCQLIHVEKYFNIYVV